jgi:hypothetical protein
MNSSKGSGVAVSGGHYRSGIFVVIVRRVVGAAAVAIPLLGIFDFGRVHDLPPPPLPLLVSG